MSPTSYQAAPPRNEVAALVVVVATDVNVFGNAEVKDAFGDVLELAVGAHVEDVDALAAGRKPVSWCTVAKKRLAAGSGRPSD